MATNLLTKWGTKPPRNKSSLAQLAELEGFTDTMDFLEHLTFDGDVLSNGICSFCGMTYKVEPDCWDGKCGECGRNGVNHAFVLAGIL